MADRLLDTGGPLVTGAAIMLAFLAGYKLAQRNRPQLSSKKDDDAAAGAAGPSGFTFENMSFSDSGDYKMVFLVRNDLKMGKGKIAAQCGHAAVGAYQSAMKRMPHVVRSWENSGCAKIALKCDDKAQLMELRTLAKQNQLNTCLIRDAGRTQIEPNSITVVAIGPARVSDIDVVTSHLKLL